MFAWLLNSAVASFVLLLFATIATRIWRQPVDRLRIIQWTLGAVLVAIMLVSVPSFSALSVAEFSPIKPVSPSSAIVKHNATTIAPATNALPTAKLSPEPTASDGHPTPGHTTASQTPTSPTQQASIFSRIDFKSLAIRTICGAYLAGILVFFVRWAAARIRLQRILSRAVEVPAGIQAEWSRVTNHSPRRVALVASPDIAVPIMWGTRKPVIVLPASALAGGVSTPLRYYLAHEWAHVARNDYATWQLATLLQFILYYQPLFWWLRRRLATSMDQLADAAASAQSSSPADYAAFLVQLARHHLTPAPQLSLSIHDKHSRLHQRVVCLLEAAPPRLACTRKTTLLFGAVAIALGALVSAVRLTAAPEPAEPIADEKAEKDSNPNKADEKKNTDKPKKEVAAITYTGRVVDHASGKPVVGAVVSVYRKLSRDPKTGGWSDLETTQHETDADGKYTFVVPPEQAAQSSLYLEVDAHHPDYAAKGRSGYSHAMIRKNLKLGEEPFYSKIELWPGEAITGKLVSPEGEPLAGVEISMYSASKESKSFPRGSFDKTQTDVNGSFRIVLATPGDGVLWLKPEKYSPQAIRIGDRRGDFGTITMQTGKTFTGHVLDVKGQPVADVRVGARRRGDGEQADEFLNTNSVANQIGREAVTGNAGEFTLASLPDGDYQLQIERNSKSYDPQPLEQVFLRQKLTISPESTADDIEIRAVPHVVIQATVLNSKGKPSSGHQLTLFGRMDGNFYAEQSSTPGKDGKLEVKAPHGLQQVELDLMTNEHGSLRWRKSPTEPLRNGRRVKLGTLEEDITGFEIIRYTAPIVLVKPVDEEGKPIRDCQPIIKYTKSNQPGDTDYEMTVYSTGSHVSFERQNDGRWRSSQALPDEPMSITVEKHGYTTAPQETSLKEGEEREFVFVLKKSAEDGDKNKTADKDK
jgi:beta-lactamase regulating signal transducer with metallopeptidase domain/5-hydroxyisourate hydrolase-like protein (transthyretin family)